MGVLIVDKSVDGGCFCEESIFGWQGEKYASKSCQRRIFWELDWIGEESANAALAKVNRFW